MNSNYVLELKFDYPQSFAFHMMQFQFTTLGGRVSPFIGIKSEH